MTEHNHPEKDQKIYKKLLKVFPPMSLLGIAIGSIGGYLYHWQAACNGST